MTTIVDLAAMAGVSIKTVSRVINDEPHVRPALRKKVLAAIAATGYRPNYAARRLVSNRSYLISFVIYDESNSYFARLATAAAAECRIHGYHLVSETYDPGESRAELVRRITSLLHPDGIILAPPLCNDRAILDAIASNGTSLVRIAGNGQGYGEIVPVHDEEISRSLVEHILDCGHRRIGMISPPSDHEAAQERLAGYKSALRSAGIAIDPELVVKGDFSFASGVRATTALLQLKKRPTAIFAANDGMALGALAVANKAGLSVPKELAIAGFNDSPNSRMVFPALTTVRQPIADIAKAAVLTLLGAPEKAPRLLHELIIRGSTTGSNELVLSPMDV